MFGALARGLWAAGSSRTAAASRQPQPARRTAHAFLIVVAGQPAGTIMQITLAAAEEDPPQFRNEIFQTIGSECDYPGRGLRGWNATVM